MGNDFKEQLKAKMDGLVHDVFRVSKSFPREEVYITVSQLKRAALSVILNYVEGYARLKKGNQLNFFEISYGSLKETKYLLYFSLQEKFLDHEEYQKLLKKIDEIGAMLWTEIRSLSESIEN